MGPVALPAVIEALKDNNIAIRLGAAKALQSMGVKAKAAVPGLANALDDENYKGCALLPPVPCSTSVPKHKPRCQP